MNSTHCTVGVLAAASCNVMRCCSGVENGWILCARTIPTYSVCSSTPSRSFPPSHPCLLLTQVLDSNTIFSQNISLLSFLLRLLVFVVLPREEDFQPLTDMILNGQPLRMGLELLDDTVCQNWLELFFIICYKVRWGGRGGNGMIVGSVRGGRSDRDKGASVYTYMLAQERLHLTWLPMFMCTMCVYVSSACLFSHFQLIQTYSTQECFRAQRSLTLSSPG